MTNNGTTKIKIFISDWHYLQNVFKEEEVEEVNKFMEKVESKGGEIVDIKFQVNKIEPNFRSSIMVIYKL